MAYPLTYYVFCSGGSLGPGGQVTITITAHYNGQTVAPPNNSIDARVNTDNSIHESDYSNDEASFVVTGS
jgi:hypothetical protein